MQVSVVVPTFNRKEKLLECLASLERQTISLQEFEVIVVDDGSTDETGASVQEYLTQAKLQLKFIQSEHAGPGVARNVGVQHASGDIIAFIEDDVIEGVTLLQGSSESVRVFDEPEHFSFIPCNLFVKKDVFVRLGGYDAHFFDKETNLYFREDADFGFRMLEAECRMLKVNDVVVHHPQQYFSVQDAFKHSRRFYFDPLLYAKHPHYFRKLLEVKEIAFLTIKRPFHYLCLFHILFFLLILLAVIIDNFSGIIAPVLLLLIFHTGIRFRYERLYVPKLWNVVDTAKYLVLPFYYMYWFLLGCRKFKSWGSLL
jgi:glycosyltransferase involved in cell wall biosynthesis